MSLTVIVLLGVLWAAILAPAAFRGRGGRSPVATVDSFERSMGILASRRLGPPRGPGRHVMVVSDPARLSGRLSRSQTLRRRRRILEGLGAAVLVTGAGALLVGGTFVLLFALAAVALGLYVALLLQLRSIERRGRRVVRRIDTADAPRPRPISARRVADRIA